jgi:hypothetical protein
MRTRNVARSEAVSLARLLESIGSAVLRPVAGQSQVTATVDQSHFYDELDAPPTSAVVLGVGLHDQAQIIAAVRRLGAVGAVALVVRDPLPASLELLHAVHSESVCLIELDRNSSWGRLAAELAILFASSDEDSPIIAGVPPGDLFAAANAVRALVGAPITIEDHQFQVVAFSVGQEDTDSWRVDTILGRQAPEHQLAVLEKAGFLRQLYATEQPLYFDPRADNELVGVRPRVAVTVRAGHQVLGSIWAVLDDPPDADRARCFVDAARLVAQELSRHRSGIDAARHQRTDAVATALGGGASANTALARLGLATRYPLAVVALGLQPDLGPASATNRIADGEATMEVAADRLSTYLTTSLPHAVAARLGDVTYAIVPVSADASGAMNGVVRCAQEILQWIGERGVIAIGNIADDVAGLAHSRVEADQVLGVLRRNAGARRVARLDDVRADVLLADLAAVDCYPSAAVGRLTAYDAKHRSHLVATLRAWLDAHGDNIAAAAAVHVHPNTFRYRLRRILQVGKMDLADPDERFAADLHLRLLNFREGCL